MQTLSSSSSNFRFIPLVKEFEQVVDCISRMLQYVANFML